ncbi:MAG: choice-of-anchor J domain-containing protein [Prevotellaceae bacterium]|jgi:hypothetical protein|nr:choice-of-anchor J domain-containing protein [Prevotellaceae bacterium]
MKILRNTALALTIAVAAASCVKKDWDKPQALTMATPDKFVTSLSENFNSVSSVDGQHLMAPKGWCNTGRDGWHRAFQTAIFGATYNDPLSPHIRCAQATSYLALGDTTDAWLITPPLKIANGAAFTYTAAIAYNSSSKATVEVRCYSASSESTTTPSLSNLNDWQLIKTLSDTIPYNGSGANIPFTQQSHTLSSYGNVGDVMYVAFRYFIPKYPSSNTWYFDDIKYN